MAVVRNHDQRAVVPDQKLPQPVDRIQVQVVRRLVQQQRLGMPEERLRQQHAHFLAALQLRHLSLVQRVADIEPLQKHRRIAFGGVAVLFADDALQLSQAHARLMGHLRLRVQLVAFGERRPQPVIAHDHRVDHAVAVERILILAKDAQLARARHRAALRVELAREQLHERRFARTVRPRQPIPPPGRKRHRDVVEQDFRAEPHGDTLR